MRLGSLEMRRTERLFEIIQILRAQNRPITAEAIADRVEVSVRTVYRDIHALQAMRTPIEGEAGIGYVMRRGYDLPPINFSAEEVEAIVVGLSLVSRTGDVDLRRAASRVLTKVESVRDRLESFQVSEWGAGTPELVDPKLLRDAIREERKLRIVYRDARSEESERIILPIVMIYYVESIVVAAWCQLRGDFRHFKVERILRCEASGGTFKGRGERLRKAWRAIEE